MSKAPFDVLIQKLEQARCLEDIFGFQKKMKRGEQRRRVNKEYLYYASFCHPDRFLNQSSDIQEKAKITLQYLNELKEKADSQLSSGQYGQQLPIRGIHDSGSKIVIASQTQEYELVRHITDLDIGMLYECLYHDGDNTHHAIAKISDDVSVNSFITREYEIISKILESENDKATKHFSQYIPSTIESFSFVEPDGKHRAVNIFKKDVEMFSWQQIHEGLHPKYLESKHFVWMFNRLLEILMWTHQQGVVHGAILPPNILAQPDTKKVREEKIPAHRGMLINWHFGLTLKGDKYPRQRNYLPEWEEFYPKELHSKQPAHPSFDVYMAAASAVYLVGGDVSKRYIPNHIEAEFQEFLFKALDQNPSNRFKDGMEMLHAFDELRETVHGKRTFHLFTFEGN